MPDNKLQLRKGNGVLWMTLNWECFVSDFGDQKLNVLLHLKKSANG